MYTKKCKFANGEIWHYHCNGSNSMKKNRKTRAKQRESKPKEPIRTLLKQEGKMVHGTRGKPTRGPRGNKH
jgi:hypothetical protein